MYQEPFTEHNAAGLRSKTFPNREGFEEGMGEGAAAGKASETSGDSAHSTSATQSDSAGSSERGDEQDPWNDELCTNL